jgi:hypothetical protein
MKKALCRVTGMLALAFLAAYAVQAQEPVLANIPFAFTAGAITLPAGEYRVQKLAVGSAVLLIQGTDQSAATLVMSNVTEANRPQTKSKMIFHCYGNRHFLSQIWVEGNSSGIELPRSAQEKEALQARNGKPEQVTIVARLMASDH